MNENEKLYFDSDDDWDDIDFSDLTDEPEVNENDESEVQSDADNAGAGGETNDGNAEVTDANQADGTDAQRTDEQDSNNNGQSSNQNFVLRYMGEDKEFTREETTTLAQKGMDYDRIRRRAEELANELGTTKKKAEFLDELAKRQNITADQLMLNVRASVMAREENISQDEANLRIREEAIAKQTEAAKKAQDEEQDRRRQFTEFFEAHKHDNGGKGVGPTDIPQSCFQDMARGIRLEDSYGKYIQEKNFNAKKAEIESKSAEFDSMRKLIEQQAKELEELKAQYASVNQNELNRMRSVGSTASKGNQTKDSKFDAAWYDGT